MELVFFIKKINKIKQLPHLRTVFVYIFYVRLLVLSDSHMDIAFLIGTIRTSCLRTVLNGSSLKSYVVSEYFYAADLAKGQTNITSA